MSRRMLVWSLVMLICPLTAVASDIVCGDALGLTPPGYQRNIDPSEVPPGCFIVPKETTLTQRALYQSIGEKRYLKVVDGVLVEKDAGEKAAVDAIIATEQAAQAEVIAVVQDPTCTATLAQIDTFLTNDAASIQTDIDAVTNIATAKTALTTMKTHTYLLFRRLIKCVLARTGGLQ